MHCLEKLGSGVSKAEAAVSGVIGDARPNG
jgi:hypothetical protein